MCHCIISNEISVECMVLHVDQFEHQYLFYFSFLFIASEFRYKGQRDIFIFNPVFTFFHLAK